jgi:hypothetical protein
LDATANSDAPDRPETHASSREWTYAYAVVAVFLLPVLALAPAVVGRHALLPADAQAHAAVAQAIARGIPHGWVDVYNAGFPVGLHYQSVPILVVAALVALGMSAVSAVSLVGFLAVVAIPPLLVGCLRAAGARPGPAAAGALLAFWAAPGRAFYGIADAYLAQGLLSQAFCLAVALVFLRTLLGGRHPWLLAPLAALVLLSHTQLGLLVLVTATPAVAIAASGATRRAFALAVFGALLVAGAVYGPGALAMRVPFSWSKGSLEAISSFPIESPLDWLLAGSLLDRDRLAVATVAAIFGLLGLLVSARCRSSRATVASFALLAVIAVSGRFISSTPLGSALELFSPLRAAALLIPAAGAVAALGWGEWLRRLERIAPRRAAIGGAWLFALAIGAFGVATRVSWLRDRAQVETDLRGDHECGPSTPDGYRTDLVRDWVKKLSAGRLVIDTDSFRLSPGVALSCPALHGLEIDSAAPLGATLGGPGSQVGVMQEAFESLRLPDPGAAARAEALGVRTVLHVRARRPQSPFAVQKSRGDVELSVREGGTGYVGVGCVRARWSAPDRALRDRLFATLGRPGNVLDDPRALVELSARPGPFAEEPVVDEACDATAADVRESPREPGAYEAWIDASAPVDAVIRASAVPGWRVEIDGASARTRVVAPGFPSARVPPGRHHVVAVVSLPRFYLAGIFSALALVAALSVGLRRPAARSGPTARPSAC